MDKEVALHFRDEFRGARAVALKDAEAFEEIVFVLERMGVFLAGKVLDLFEYERFLGSEALNSPLAVDIPQCCPEYHASFSVLYSSVRNARNDALHQGAYARHLTAHAIELSVVLEDALMNVAACAKDFMVRDPVCAQLWQPISFIRRTMLINSFSYLPVYTELDETHTWHLLSDFAVASFLRDAKSNSARKKRLASKLKDVIAPDKIQLVVAPQCHSEDNVSHVLAVSKGLPVLVLGTELPTDLRGIITPFDVL